MNYKVLIGYQHKAELNYETNMLISKFKCCKNCLGLKEYRYLMLMQTSGIREVIEDKFDEMTLDFKNFILKETTVLQQRHDELDRVIDGLSKDQDDLEKEMHVQF